MKAIKNILVPVDFSANAKAAFEYAVALGEDLGAESVKALYIYDDYMPVAPLADPLIISGGKTEEELAQDLQKFIESEAEELGDVLVKTKTMLKTQAIYGSPAKTIQAFSASGDYDLIVMGTTSKKNVGEIWFGSTASSVSQKAECPVLLVPVGAVYKGTKEMIYACDFDHTSVKQINVIADIAKTLKTNVELVFVKTDEDEASKAAFNVKKMRQAFTQVAPDINFTAHIVEEVSVVDGVNSFAEKVGADFVTVVTKHRSFWQRFVHSSMTKQLAMYAELPVLVIHVDE